MTTTSDSVTIEGRLVEAASDLPSTFPRWIQPALHVTAGRDPISLQTITIDRIMPRLAPALLALSRRARYFSIYPFLLDAFQTHRGEPTRAALSRFIKQREFDLAVAMQICPNGCGSKPSAIVGQDRAGPAARTPVEELPRGESVQSELGGYGLYYRTPLIELGLVAPAGTPFGPDEELTPVDILANERARLLASRFRCAIENTRYYREFFRGIQPSIPREVLAELADVCCLCKLGMFPEEQAAIRSALLEAHDDVTLAASAQDVRRQETEQRRRSVALVLWAISREPSVATGPDHEGAFRRAIWQGFEEHQRERTPLAETLAQWAALIAKDVAQEALSSMWSETCRRGFATQPSDGMTRKELERFIREDLAGQRQIKIGDGA